MQKTVMENYILINIRQFMTKNANSTKLQEEKRMTLKTPLSKSVLPF